MRDCVEFLPIQEDMTLFYESIDCLLLPSKLESFGMVGSEAMAFGKPVICSSTCGFSEKILDGQNSWVFKKNNLSVYNLYKKMLEACDGQKYFQIRQYIQESYENNDEASYNKVVAELIGGLL